MSKKDSTEEEQFHLWLIEAEENGLVTNVEYHPEHIILYPSSKVPFNKQLKTKVKVIEKHLLAGLRYEPDFTFSLTEKFMRIFKKLNIFDINGKHYEEYQQPFKVIADTKGGFVGFANNSGITFPIKQKVVWHEKSVYIQKIIPKDWFKKTFLPAKLAYKKTGGLRVEATRCKLLKNFLGE